MSALSDALRERAQRIAQLGEQEPYRSQRPRAYRDAMNWLEAVARSAEADEEHVLGRRTLAALDALLAAHEAGGLEMTAFGIARELILSPASDDEPLRPQPPTPIVGGRIELEA